VDRAYTNTQGQYLAFIYYYTKIHGVAPAEADMQRYFKVSPPSAHNMVVTLESAGSSLAPLARAGQSSSG